MEHSRFSCNYEGCLKSFSNKFNLKRHLESFHLGMKNFFCPVCSKGLSTKQNMREHMFIHEGTKPYTCQYSGCQEAFRQLSQLKLHHNMHKQLISYFEKENQNKNIDLQVFSRALEEFDVVTPSEVRFEDIETVNLIDEEKKFKIQTGVKFC